MENLLEKNPTNKTNKNKAKPSPLPKHWKITARLLRYLYLDIFKKEHQNHNHIEDKANVCILCA